MGTFRAAITSKNWVNRAVKNDHKETHNCLSRKKWFSDCYDSPRKCLEHGLNIPTYQTNNCRLGLIWFPIADGVLSGFQAAAIDLLHWHRKISKNSFSPILIYILYILYKLHGSIQSIYASQSNDERPLQLVSKHLTEQKKLQRHSSIRKPVAMVEGKNLSMLSALTRRSLC